MFNKLSEIRNSIMISRRLKGLLVLIALLTIVLGTVSVRNVNKINNKINEINDIYLKSLIKTTDLIENIYSLLIESHIIDEKSLSENAIENSLNLNLLNTYLLEYEQSIVDEAQRSQYNSFILELNNYLAILKEVSSLELQGKYQVASEVRADREIKSFKKLQANIQSMEAFNIKGIQTSNELINNLEKKSINQIYIISFLILVFSLLITFYLIKDISVSLKALTNNLSVLQKGEIPETGLVETGNELGQMAGLTNALTRNLAELNRFANDISKGNYSSEYEFAGKNDLLGKALVNLRNSLRISKEEDEKRKIEDERRNWTNKGLAIFSEILRQRSQEVGKLTDDIIKNLVYYLNANQGGLFLINDTGDISKIDLVSAFAYDRKKFFERSINIGDGLIGTVALERNTIYLKEIPEDYIIIESGLGDARPISLLIVPLKFEEDILGIVEIASFKEFQDYEIKFVEEVAQSIASTLLTVKINARTQQLLDESRKQSEILAAQEIEARQNMEEMRATQELAQRREADLSGIISAVDNTLMKGEYEIDGTLISVNNRHLQTMGYQLKEIKGKNIEMFIPKEELEDFRKVWASVVAGNPRQLEVKRRTKTGEVLWLINQYTPVTDVSGKINKVLYFAHDITKFKKVEEESSKQLPNQVEDTKELEEIKEKLKKTEEILEQHEKSVNGIINTIETDLIFFEFDFEKVILKINNKFEKLFGITQSEIIGKKISDFLTITYDQNEFDQVWENLSNGLSANLVVQYETQNGSIIWLHEFYTVLLNIDDEPVKIKAIAYNISKEKLCEQKNEYLISETKALSEALTQKEEEINITLENLKSLGQDKNLGSDENEKIIEALNSVFPRFDLDLNLKFLHVNKSFSSIYNFDEWELIDKPLSRIISKENIEQFERYIEKVANEKVNQIKTVLVSKNKEENETDLYIIPYKLDNKEEAKIIMFVIKTSENINNNNDLGELSKDLEKKNEEIVELNKQLVNLKDKLETKQTITNEGISDEAIDLYSSWLQKLKKNIK